MRSSLDLYLDPKRACEKTHHVGFRSASKFKKSVTMYVYAAFETMAMRNVLSTLRRYQFTRLQLGQSRHIQDMFAP